MTDTGELERLRAENERLRRALDCERRISRLLGGCNDLQMMWKLAEQFDLRCAGG